MLSQCKVSVRAGGGGHRITSYEYMNREALEKYPLWLTTSFSLTFATDTHRAVFVDAVVVRPYGVTALESSHFSCLCTVHRNVQ